MVLKHDTYCRTEERPGRPARTAARDHLQSAALQKHKHTQTHTLTYAHTADKHGALHRLRVENQQQTVLYININLFSMY